MKFNITKIVPEGFIHTQGVNEVIESLSWSLSALGHDVNCTQNWLSEQQETNIIFGAEVLADYQKLPRQTIIFNLEQPSHPNMAKVRKLAEGLQVWDYSPRNINEWRRLGYDVRHVPIGFTPNLTRIPKAPVQDIDVLFYGWMTPRRVAIIEQLKAAGLKVHATAACYGGGRDNLISRSKVCLNMHHDGRDMFEIVRTSYMMANSKCVLTEESSDQMDYLDLDPGLLQSPYRSLVDRCRSLVSIGAYEDRESLALDAIRKRDFTASVAAALTTPSPQEMPESFRSLSPLVGGQNGAGILSRYEFGCHSGDMMAFLPWLRAQAHGNILEIGVRDGASTSAFLLGLESRGGHLYSVDVQPMPSPFSHPQWTFIQANSTDFARVGRQVPYELDILLIDGDHSRAGVLADFKYAHQLRPGGLVLFHDVRPEEKPSGCTDMSWPSDDVRNVFEELSAALIPQGWTSEVLPGRYGLGVLRKPL